MFIMSRKSNEKEINTIIINQIIISFFSFFIMDKNTKLNK